MKALSIRAPWWWFILHGGKDVENRDWSTKFRGRVLIHASKWFNLQEVGQDSADAMAIYRSSLPCVPAEVTFRQMRELGGTIVGSVEIVDCVSNNHDLKSPWFFGDYGFVLRNPIAFAYPAAFKGALGFFDVPDEIVQRNR